MHAWPNKSAPLSGLFLFSSSLFCFDSFVVVIEWVVFLLTPRGVLRLLYIFDNGPFRSEKEDNFNRHIAVLHSKSRLTSRRVIVMGQWCVHVPTPSVVFSLAAPLRPNKPTSWGTPGPPRAKFCSMVRTSVCPDLLRPSTAPAGPGPPRRLGRSVPPPPRVNRPRSRVEQSMFSHKRKRPTGDAQGCCSSCTLSRFACACLLLLLPLKTFENFCTIFACSQTRTQTLPVTSEAT